MSDADDDAALGLRASCWSYAPGHTPHFIQAIHSGHKGEVPPVDGKLVEVNGDGLVMVRLEDGNEHIYWNHEPARLLRLASRNDGRVSIQERWHLLRTPSPEGSYCFSIIKPGDAYYPCIPPDPSGLVDFDALGFPEDIATLFKDHFRRVREDDRKRIDALLDKVDP